MLLCVLSEVLVGHGGDYPLLGGRRRGCFCPSHLFAVNLAMDNNHLYKTPNSTNSEKTNVKFKRNFREVLVLLDSYTYSYTYTQDMYIKDM